MTESNEDRAALGESVVDYFASLTNMQVAGEEFPTIISDLIADVAHYCEQNGIDPRGAMESGLESYDEDRKPEIVGGFVPVKPITQSAPIVPAPQKRVLIRVGLKVEAQPTSGGMWYPAKITGYARDHLRVTDIEVAYAKGYQVVAGHETQTLPVGQVRRDAYTRLYSKPYA